MKRLVALLGVAVVGFSPGVANGATALIVGGKGDYATLTDEQMSTALGGIFADDTRVSVPFPGTADFRRSTEVGAANLYQAVYATSGPKIIGGVSEGVAAVEVVLRKLMQDENRPLAKDLRVVIYGRPNATLYRAGGVKYQPLPDTPYDILVVKAQYDGIADWPDNPFNLLAVTNALLGADQLHVPGGFYDISTVPASYITTTRSVNGGTITTVLIPTQVLPILKSLADSGTSPELVKRLDAILRPMIDSAYRRPAVPVASTTARTAGGPVALVASSAAPQGSPIDGDIDRSEAPDGVGHTAVARGQRKMRQKTSDLDDAAVAGETDDELAEHDALDGALHPDGSDGDNGTEVGEVHPGIPGGDGATDSQQSPAADSGATPKSDDSPAEHSAPAPD